MKIGKKLKSIRQELGFSQKFIAEKLNIKRQAVVLFEQDKRKIDSYELFKILDLYNIRFEDLFVKNSNMDRYKNLGEDIKLALLQFEKIYEDYKFLEALKQAGK